MASRPEGMQISSVSNLAMQGQTPTTPPILHPLDLKQIQDLAQGRSYIIKLTNFSEEYFLSLLEKLRPYRSRIQIFEICQYQAEDLFSAKMLDSLADCLKGCQTLKNLLLYQENGVFEQSSKMDPKEISEATWFKTKFPVTYKESQIRLMNILGLCLQHLPIVHFGVRGFSFSDKESSDCLSVAFRKNPSLQKVWFVDCSFTNQAVSLIQALAETSAKSLDFRNSHLSENIFQELFRSLVRNKRLMDLNLEACECLEIMTSSKESSQSYNQGHAEIMSSVGMQLAKFIQSCSLEKLMLKNFLVQSAQKSLNGEPVASVGSLFSSINHPENRVMKGYFKFLKVDQKIRNEHLRCLDLSSDCSSDPSGNDGFNLPLEEVQVLSELLCTLPGLKALKLPEMTQAGEKACKVVVDALRKTQLEVLKLAVQFTGNENSHPGYILQVCPSIHTLNLSGSLFTPNSIKQFKTVVEKNQKLRSLTVDLMYEEGILNVHPSKQELSDCDAEFAELISNSVSLRDLTINWKKRNKLGHLTNFTSDYISEFCTKTLEAIRIHKHIEAICFVNFNQALTLWNKMYEIFKDNTVLQKIELQRTSEKAELQRKQALGHMYDYVDGLPLVSAAKAAVVRNLKPMQKHCFLALFNHTVSQRQPNAFSRKLGLGPNGHTELSKNIATLVMGYAGILKPDSELQKKFLRVANAHATAAKVASKQSEDTDQRPLKFRKL